MTFLRCAQSTFFALVLFAPIQPVSADPVRDSQWHLRFLRVPEAHAISRGQGVIVAVVDNGVDKHPDLRNNLLPGIDLAARHVEDGHGTAMAGIIAAHGNGADGALGIAPGSKILPVAIDMVTAGSKNDTAAEGIEWAIDHGANIINISGSGSPVPSLRSAIDRALAADIVVVAAAGNRPSPSLGFPALYPGVVAVGAIDRNGNIADISVEGNGIQLVAPGVDIHSTSTNGRYQRGTGTSDSAAVVSGAAAIIRSRFPELSAEEVVHRLTATAIDKGAPGWDEQYGYGVLNLMGALTADVPPLSGSPTVGVPSTAVSDGVAAPETPRGGGLGLPGVVGALVVVGALITAFVFRVRARRRADGAGPVP